MKAFALQGGGSIPAIGFGTFGSDHASPAQVSEAVALALRAGYRMLDCAQVYQNERQIGAVICGALRDGVVTRDELFIASKVWNDMHGEGDVLRALTGSLKDLQLQYLDAYFVHWPLPNYHAPGCDGDSRNPKSRPFSADEFMGVWRQMERSHDMGLVRSLGMSNMTVSKLQKVLPRCRIVPALIEMELHPSFQQRALFDYCLERGIRPVGFSPLGSPNRPERDRTADDVVDTELAQVRAVAQAHGVHPALICLKWASQRGAVPIPFSVNPRNINANLACIHEDPLTPEEMTLLEGAERNCRLIKGQVFLWPGATDWTEIWE